MGCGTSTSAANEEPSKDEGTEGRPRGKQDNYRKGSATDSFVSAKEASSASPPATLSYHGSPTASPLILVAQQPENRWRDTTAQTANPPGDPTMSIQLDKCEECDAPGPSTTSSSMLDARKEPPKRQTTALFRQPRQQEEADAPAPELGSSGALAAPAPMVRRRTEAFEENATACSQDSASQNTATKAAEKRAMVTFKDEPGVAPRAHTPNSTMNSEYFRHQFTLPSGVLCRGWVGKYNEPLPDGKFLDESTVPDVVMKEIVPLQPQKRTQTEAEAIAAVIKDLTFYRVCSNASLAPILGAVARDDRVVAWSDHFPLGNISKRAGAMPEEPLQKLIVEVGCGLRYLNSRQLPHRHLTLENVLQFEQGFALSDCGLGSLFLGMTADDVYAMGYRSSSMFPPETIAADAEGIDPEKCDVWAFGCIAYQLAFGCQPFRGETKEELFAAIKLGNPEHLADGNDKFSKDFIAFVTLCMNPDPTQRPRMMALLRHGYMKEQVRVFSASSSSLSSTPQSFRKIDSTNWMVQQQTSFEDVPVLPSPFDHFCDLSLSLVEEILAEHQSFSNLSESLSSPATSMGRASMTPKTSMRSQLAARQTFSNTVGAQLVSSVVHCAACGKDVSVGPSFRACRQCDFILCGVCATYDVEHDASHVLQDYVIEAITFEQLKLVFDYRTSSRRLSLQRQRSSTTFGYRRRSGFQSAARFSRISISESEATLSRRVSLQQSGTFGSPGMDTAHGFATAEGDHLPETNTPDSDPALSRTSTRFRVLFFIIPMDLLTEEEKTRFHVSGHLPMGKLKSLHKSRKSSSPAIPSGNVSLSETLTPNQVQNSANEPPGPSSADIIKDCIDNACPDLDLTALGLEGVPPIVFDGRLAHLLSLDLSDNSLTELPFEIGFLSNLQELRVSNNQLKALPDGLGDLAMLERLDANHNQLEDLPQTFMFAESLATLSLDYNNFKSIPEVIFDMASLQTAYFAANSEITHLPAIELFSHIQQPLQLGLDNEPTLFREYEENAGKLKNVTVMWNKIYPDEVIPGLFCGSLRSAQTPHVYERLKITHILTAGRGLDPLVVPGMRQLTIQLDDVENASISHMLGPSFEFIDEALKSGGGCLVHCFAGMSRSASACIAYLMKSRSMRLDDAYNLMKRGRPAIYPNKGFFNQLLAYDKELFPDGRPLDIDSMHREIIP